MEIDVGLILVLIYGVVLGIGFTRMNADLPKLRRELEKENQKKPV